MSPLTAKADELCPCVPVTKLWVSSVYENWNSAIAAMVNGNGDPTMIAMPVAMNDGRWMVVRQVTSGNFSDNSPFQVESFDGLADASARYAGIMSDFKPHILSSPDGRFLVISLRQLETVPPTRRRPAH